MLKPETAEAIIEEKSTKNTSVIEKNHTKKIARYKLEGGKVLAVKRDIEKTKIWYIGPEEPKFDDNLEILPKTENGNDNLKSEEKFWRELHKSRDADGNVRRILVKTEQALRDFVNWYMILDSDSEAVGSIGGSCPSTASEKSQGERLRKLYSVLARPEQAKFRKAIVERDGEKCALTRCEDRPALHAAHLKAVSDDGLDEAENGVILRADIHLLFDSGLLKFDVSGRVLISSDVKFEEYKKLNGVMAASEANFALAGK